MLKRNLSMKAVVIGSTKYICFHPIPDLVTLEGLLSSHDILQLRGTSTASPRVALHSVKDSIWFSTIATKPLIVSPREPRDRRKPRPRSAKHRILRDHLSSKWYARRLKAYEYLPAFQGAGFHMFKPGAFASFAALAALKRVFILLRAQLVHCPLCYLLIVVSFTPAVDRPEVPVTILTLQICMFAKHHQRAFPF